MSSNLEEMLASGTGNSRDTRLLKRALKQRWPIPEDKKQAIIDRQVKIATDEGASPREATDAARTVIMADRINMEDEKVEQKSVEQHLHLHQHQETQVNLDNLSVEQLEKLEQLLIVAQSTTSEVITSPSEARQVEPVSVREVGVE